VSRADPRRTEGAFLPTDREGVPHERPKPQQATLRVRAKSTICGLIAALPSRWWPLASAIVRHIWPKGMRDA
jgi:hypothetical protein